MCTGLGNNTSLMIMRQGGVRYGGARSGKDRFGSVR